MTYRFQIQRMKGWQKPEGGVSVARPHRWSNPYSVDALGRDTASRLYCEDLEAGCLRDPWTGEALTVAKARAELRGHPLGCFCRLDEACHADVLLAFIREGDGP